MIVRIFTALLLLNLLVGWSYARAEVQALDSQPVLENRLELMERYGANLSNDDANEKNRRETLSEISSRFLRWQLTAEPEGQRYASEGLSQNHAIRFFGEGATLNLGWEF